MTKTGVMMGYQASHDLGATKLQSVPDAHNPHYATALNLRNSYVCKFII